MRERLVAFLRVSVERLWSTVPGTNPWRKRQEEATERARRKAKATGRLYVSSPDAEPPKPLIRMVLLSGGLWEPVRLPSGYNLDEVDLRKPLFRDELARGVHAAKVRITARRLQAEEMRRRGRLIKEVEQGAPIATLEQRGGE